MEVPFRRQFRSRKFRTDYGFADDFILHQWQNTANVDYVGITYRFSFFATLLVTGYILLRSSTWERFETWKRVIYFSNWTLVMCLVYALLSLINVLVAHVNLQEDPLSNSNPDNPSLIKTIWIFHTIALDCSICMGLVMWSLQIYVQLELSLGSKIYHMIVPMCMLMDFFVISLPERILHCYITVIYGVIYITFSYVFQLTGLNNSEDADYVYQFTDWKRAPVRCALYSTLSIALVIATRFLVYWLYRLKQCMRDYIFDAHDYNIESGRSYSSANDSSCNLSRF